MWIGGQIIENLDNRGSDNRGCTVNGESVFGHKVTTHGSLNNNEPVIMTSLTFVKSFLVLPAMMFIFSNV